MSATHQDGDGAARGVIEHDGASAFQVLPLLLVRAQVQQRAANPLLLQPGHDVVATLQPAVGRRHRVQHQRAVGVGGNASQGNPRGTGLLPGPVDASDFPEGVFVCWAVKISAKAVKKFLGRNCEKRREKATF